MSRLQVSDFPYKYLFEYSHSFLFYRFVRVSDRRLFHSRSYKYISNGAYRLVFPHTRLQSAVQSVCQQILSMVDGISSRSFSCSRIKAVWMERNIHYHNRNDNARQPFPDNHVFQSVQCKPISQIAVRSNHTVPVLLW